MAQVTLMGNPVTTSGELPAVGSQAPDFRLVGVDLGDLTLATYAGKRKVLNIVPSLDTPTCQASTRAFNERADALDNTVVLVVSADLPFAQGRFCAGESLSEVVTAAMMRGRDFAKSYGVLITDGPLEGVTARAVVVIDETDKVVYTQLVGEIADEPDYDSAIAALG